MFAIHYLNLKRKKGKRDSKSFHTQPSDYVQFSRQTHFSSKTKQGMTRKRECPALLPHMNNKSDVLGMISVSMGIGIPG